MVLNLTIPFVTQIKFGKHPGVLAETNDYTVSLYVQPAYYLHDQRPPTPISNEVSGLGGLQGEWVVLGGW